jgi:hypothetical protein
MMIADKYTDIVGFAHCGRRSKYGMRLRQRKHRFLGGLSEAVTFVVAVSRASLQRNRFESTGPFRKEEGFLPNMSWK